MIALILKGTVVLVAAFAAAALLRRRSAALRHFLWTAAFAALLLLPILAWRVPRISVAAPAAVSDAPIPAVPAVRAAAAPAAPAIPWLPLLYGAGLLGSAAWFLVGAAHTARLVRRAAPAPRIGDDVVVAEAAPMPLAWGILRPVVVLPAAALEWPVARLRSVLLHERMHHSRRDLLAQALAQAACCVFWFHPLAWFALRQHRTERERACDDAVLREGVAPHEYATHLMDVVRAAASRGGSWADAPAMAEGSNLEIRVRALLDAGRDRRPLGRRRGAVLAMGVLAVLVPLASVQLQAQATGNLSGTVRDPSGARVPGCTVTAKNADGVHQETTVSGPAGDYRFTAIPAGHYTVEFAARGFKLARVDAELVAGAAAGVDAHLEVGQTVEKVTVTGKKPASVAVSQTQQAPQRIPVGGNVQAARLIRQPRPVYPPELQQAGVEGSVIIRAVISKEGTVLNPQVVNTAIDPRLAKAALDAVSQWQYQPTLLNGKPVEILTTISIDFQLEQ